MRSSSKQAISAFEGLSEGAPSAAGNVAAQAKGSSDDKSNQKLHNVASIALWEQLKTELSSDKSVAGIGHELNQTRCLGELDNTLFILVNSGYARDTLERKYSRLLQSKWSKLDPKNRKIAFYLASEISADLKALFEVETEQAGYRSQTTISKNNGSASVPEAPFQGTSINGDDEFSFETFAIGASNRKAEAIARRIADGMMTPAPIIVFYGLAGVGKTHLLKAILKERKRQAPDKTARYYNGVDFATRYIEAVRRKDTASINDELFSDIVLIDDLHRLDNHPGTQEKIFQLLRAATANGRQVVMSSDAPPKAMQGLKDNLTRELDGAVIIEVGQPDGALREEIIRQKTAYYAHFTDGFELSEDQTKLIASQTVATGRQLTGIVHNIFYRSALLGDPVTPEIVREALALQKSERVAPTMDEIRRKVCAHFKISRDELDSASRKRIYAYPRQVGMYLCKKNTRKSLNQIASAFGKRDHTTVIYAINKIEEMARDCKETRGDIEAIEQRLFADS